jgi:hypothetical protein
MGINKGITMSDDYFVVHIPKKKMWEKISDILVGMGYYWDGASARNYWHVFGDQSCIRIDHESKQLMFSGKRWYQRHHECIFDTKTFMNLYNKFYGFFGFFRTLILRVNLYIRKYSYEGKRYI